jgi:hypothetical protein
MIRRSTLIAVAAGIVACGAMVTQADARMVGRGTPEPKAPPSQVDSGTAFFSITHSTKRFEYAAGNLDDGVFGTSAITYALKILPSNVSGSVRVTANVVLYTKAGSLTGTATATINDVTSKTQTITNGKLKLTKGFGALKGDKLTAKFSGTANLTANTLQFKYRGQLTS